MNPDISFPTILDALLDGGVPFPPRHLHRFSDLTPDELESFSHIWPKVPNQRQRTFLEDLEELADADTVVSFDNLALLLLADPDGAVRAGAIRLLSFTEDAHLVPTYIKILLQDVDGGVRAAAATALRQYIYLGEIEEIPEELSSQAVDALLATHRDDPEVLVKRRALEALGVSSHPEVARLIETAFASRNNEWIVSALYAMGQSNDSRWEKEILAMLTHPSEDIRAEAIQSAGLIPLESARGILLDLLADEEEDEIAYHLIWSLSQIGGEGVRERLEELLDTTMDDDLADILEEALDNLAFTEELASFELLEFEDEKEQEYYENGGESL
ncbi:MAG: HEAT repeat domain-containing protein [Chloroflexi bacterium]|nr:HEAT repeat domain-containing protein [Chloroflexota bacterium]